MQQFHGHFLKCIYFSLRNWKLVTIQLLLPALMTATGAIIITVAARPQGEIDLDLSIRYRGSSTKTYHLSYFDLRSYISRKYQKVQKTNPWREYAKKSFYETRTPIQMPLSESLLNLSRSVFESDNSEVIECEQPINDWFIQKSSKNLMDFNRRTILGLGFTCCFRSWHLAFIYFRREKSNERRWI